jgi:16S rRNA (cytidine1402-2'-O)-methyltransferase
MCYPAAAGHGDNLATMPSTSNAKNASDATGCLYIVATPIGNLEDITLRALRILKEADLIACEDTRQTLKLLSHFDIHTRLVSYHEHNEITRAAELVIELEQGAKIALVSDAGTPAISDPGQHLVALALRHGIRVVPIPGASAVVAAIAASGMPSEQFRFIGFLPARQSERRKALRELAAEPGTLVLYEAPHRLLDALEDAVEILGNRPATIARELTKIHEEFLRDHLQDLAAAVSRKPLKGEITLLIAPASPSDRHLGRQDRSAPKGMQAAEADAAPNAVPLARRVEEIVQQRGVDRKAALKQAARERGLTKREAYKQLLITRDE